MYINFEHLITKGYNIETLINLIAIHQKEGLYIESNISEDTLDKYAESKLVEFIKTGKTKFDSVRITKLGTTFIEQCTTSGYTDTIGRLAAALQKLYRDYAVEESRIGNQPQIVSDIIWFSDSTIFSLADIYNGVEEYLARQSNEGKMQYTIGLHNIFWKPRSNNIFAVHRKLSESFLYTLLCSIHYDKTGEQLQGLCVPNTEKQKKEFTYFNTLKNLQIPTGLDDSLYMTGSRAGDIKSKKRILPEFIKKVMKNW